MSSSDSSDGENGPDNKNNNETPQVETFQELGLVDSLCEACDALGWKKPTHIQCVRLLAQGEISLHETDDTETGRHPSCLEGQRHHWSLRNR